MTSLKVLSKHFHGETGERFANYIILLGSV